MLAEGILRKEKRGKSNFFINEPLFQLLSNVSLRETKQEKVAVRAKIPSLPRSLRSIGSL
jgi:hypothetical protein